MSFTGSVTSAAPIDSVPLTSSMSLCEAALMMNARQDRLRRSSPGLLRAIAVALALVMAVVPVGASDCGTTSVGDIPLNDLGSGTYKGRQGGLYPGGSNARPASHTSAGRSLAEDRVLPRKTTGTVDTENGKLVFLSVGMSNTEQEFKRFITAANGDPSKSSRVVPVNGAQGSMDASRAAEADGTYWKVVDQRLAAADVTRQQVGVIWLKETDGNPKLRWPEYPDTLENDLAAIVRIAKDRFPNLWLVYVSSRIYAGYADIAVSPEPYAYQDAFAAKGLIERQLSGALPIGSTSAPWLSWGPYMWADGTKARSDGLTWACTDFEGDGTHPSAQGESKVVSLLMGFLHNDATAKVWYSGDAQPPGGSSDPPGGPAGPGGSPAGGTSSSSASPSTTPSASGSPTGNATGNASGTPGSALPPSSSSTGFPSTILMLALAPLVAAVTYRLLRRQPLWPRRSRAPRP
jgi:hypothetical protein